jgi:hypothetical protein
MTDLVTRLLALAEKAVDEAMQYSGGYRDLDHCKLYSELNELRQLVQQPQDGPTDEDLYDLAEVFNGDPVPAMRRALELWGRPAVKPLPVRDENQ